MSRIPLISTLAFSAALFAANPQEKPAREKKEAPAAHEPAGIERGKYIVESVALCEQCHTPRDESGNPDRGRWLMGGPVQLRPSYPAPNWAITAPPLAGVPPGTDAQVVHLLTTGIWLPTGSPPRPPMPPFRMTRADAEAVLAYIKSLAQ